MKHADGGFAPSYNVQTTTAAEGKAIVSIEVTQAGNDFDQLQPAQAKRFPIGQYMQIMADPTGLFIASARVN